MSTVRSTVSLRSISGIAGSGSLGYNGDGLSATAASLSSLRGVAVDSSGNIYIGDYINNRVRKISASTGLISTIAGIGSLGYNGDGISATSSGLSHPMGVAVDSAGDVYIVDSAQGRIRMVNASTGLISTIAGTGSNSYNSDGIAASSAQLNDPTDVKVDSQGNVFISDVGNERIRKITARSGTISTVAGTGIASYNGDGQSAVSADLSSPYGLGLDSLGNLYIADSANNRVRLVNASTGVISTVAGTGEGSYNGDWMSATSAGLQGPYDVAVDMEGNMYISDTGADRVRMVLASTGTIFTLAGDGTSGYNGDGISATSSSLSLALNVDVDSAGAVYVCDDNRLREIYAPGMFESVYNSAENDNDSDCRFVDEAREHILFLFAFHLTTSKSLPIQLQLHLSHRVRVRV